LKKKKKADATAIITIMFQKRTNRVKRAQQLKQRRVLPSSPQDGGNEMDLEMGPACTCFCALLIVALGASMAMVFFMYDKPDCMKNLGLDRQSLLRAKQG
jgi:hypothetical protein